MTDEYDYAVLVVHKPSNKCVHIVLYPDRPSKEDLYYLREELKVDLELGMIELIDECRFEVINKKGSVS